MDDADLIDTANTSAVISDGQAMPGKTIQPVEKLLYSSDEAASISDPHFVTVKQYIYDYTDKDILQLKVVSKISCEGSTKPVEKVEYIDLTDKELGKYQISLDLRKDVSADTPTGNQSFAVYVSKIKAYATGQVQTVAIPVTSGANAFILSQEGIGLDNISWSYSEDGGSTWTEFTAGSDTSLNGATSIILRATLTPGDELPTLTSFKVTFISLRTESEDFVFTGKEKDATGMYYFGARYYDPEVGGFISEDPGMDGTDWYRYCKSNPLKYLDLDGYFTVFLDPGHGGKWSKEHPDALGSVNDNTYEKNINLKVALKVQSILITNGINVSMSRTSDTYIHWMARGPMANEVNPDIFVSIHTNSAYPFRHGAKIFTAKKHNQNENFDLAYKIYVRMKQAGIRTEDSDVISEDSSLAVLNMTKMPAILVEIGYIGGDIDLLKNESYLNNLAWSIAWGIMDFRNTNGKY